MEKDFHYYLIYALAKLTKMPEPRIIAYSSQFVDDNNEGQFQIDGESEGFPERIPANGGNYLPIMTQSLFTDPPQLPRGEAEDIGCLNPRDFSAHCSQKDLLSFHCLLHCRRGIHHDQGPP